MLAVMARGDECKTANKANYACKSFEVSAPMKKPEYQAPAAQKAPPKEQKKDYGAWGPVFKDRKTFSDMHCC